MTGGDRLSGAHDGRHPSPPSVFPRSTLLYLMLGFSGQVNKSALHSYFRVLGLLGFRALGFQGFRAVVFWGFKIVGIWGFEGFQLYACSDLGLEVLRF